MWRARKHTRTPTHMQDNLPNHSVCIHKDFRVFSLLPTTPPPFLCFVIGSLPGAVADSSHDSGCPAGPLIFHQPIELKLKAWGGKLERQPLVLWQPAGACRGLFPASSNCFSFNPGAVPCCSEENEVEWRRYLGAHITATVWVGE